MRTFSDLTPNLRKSRRYFFDEELSMSQLSESVISFYSPDEEEASVAQDHSPYALPNIHLSGSPLTKSLFHQSPMLPAQSSTETGLEDASEPEPFTSPGVLSLSKPPTCCPTPPSTPSFPGLKMASSLRSDFDPIPQFSVNFWEETSVAEPRVQEMPSFHSTTDSERSSPLVREPCRVFHPLYPHRQFAKHGLAALESSLPSCSGPASTGSTLTGRGSSFPPLGVKPKTLPPLSRKGRSVSRGSVSEAFEVNFSPRTIERLQSTGKQISVISTQEVCEWTSPSNQYPSSPLLSVRQGCSSGLVQPSLFTLSDDEVLNRAQEQIGGTSDAYNEQHQRSSSSLSDDTHSTGSAGIPFTETSSEFTRGQPMPVEAQHYISSL